MKKRTTGLLRVILLELRPRGLKIGTIDGTRTIDGLKLCADARAALSSRRLEPLLSKQYEPFQF